MEIVDKYECVSSLRRDVFQSALDAWARGAHGLPHTLYTFQAGVIIGMLYHVDEGPTRDRLVVELAELRAKFDVSRTAQGAEGVDHV
jgi:hypothetical protein